MNLSIKTKALKRLQCNASIDLDVTTMFKKKDRVIVNAGTQLEPEWYCGTIIKIIPLKKAVEVLYDTGEKVVEPVDNTGVGVIGFIKPKLKGKRKKPILEPRVLLNFIDSDRWCVPNLKKLVKGFITKDNKITKAVERQQQKVDSINK